MNGETGDELFEPSITAFICSYCASMSADSAGLQRMQYPPAVKTVRLPCAGRVDLLYILRAFEEGADGVYVVGCAHGNCHYERGTGRIEARVERARRLLEQVGIESERLDIFLVSGSMGGSFTEAAREMARRIARLGPSPLGSPGPTTNDAIALLK